MSARAALQNDGAVLHVLLDAPKGNVIDTAMMGGIEAALAEHGAAHGLKAIVFEGAGEHFSFGASVAEHTADRALGMLQRFHGLFRRLGQLSVPTCALVRGRCLGGGLELAAWCTWVVATPDARLGQPEIKLAVFPPMASLLLPWRAGGGAALDLCVSGRTVDAARALELGVINAVAADPQAWWQGFYAEHLAGASASSLRFAERAVRMRLHDAMRDDLPRLERLYLGELMATHDANEGITAFLERRTPEFER